MKRLLALFLLLTVAFCAPASAETARRPLASGDTGDAVMELQQRLQDLGLSTGKADGIYGKQTAAGVTEAQRLLAAAGYDVAQTGEADADTLALLFDPEAEATLRTLRLGSRGDRVRQLQNRLIDLKLLSDDADGVYGNNTEAAVRLFEQRMIQLGLPGLTLDGVATPGLVELIMSDLSVYGFEAPIYFDESAPLALTEDDLYAKACIVMEASTGNVLFSYEADTQLYPASTTKIMTLLLALERGGLDQEITIPACAADVPKDSSLVPVYEGEQMPFLDLLYGMMIRSGNDAANAVAEHISGSVPAFVELMNQKAQELGCENTHFTNPHGLHDENHYTTPRDLMKIAEYAMKNETFASIVKIDKTVLPATNMRSETTISTTNHLISRWRNVDYYYEGAIGIKTGSTTPAGLCLVSGVQSGELTYITVVMGAEEGEDGSLGSFTETIKLLDYAKSGFSIQTMGDTSTPVTEVPVALGKDDDTVILSPESTLSALLPVDFDPDNVEVEYTVDENIKAPLEKGQVLGSATYSYEGKEYGSVNLVAAESVRRSTWLFIIDTIISIFSSTAFKIVLGVLVLAALAFVLTGVFGRRRRRGRRSSYRGRRRY